MIYTVTLNPSLDYIVSVKDFQLGLTNRTDSELLLPGGKGINVSTVLKNLGRKSTAIGFIAGFTGEEIKRKVEELGCSSKFIQIPEGNSRINIKLKSIDGTEINGKGPHIRLEDLEKLFRILDQLTDDDILVLAGSIPSSLPDSMYRDIMNRFQKKETMIIVDATKDLLLHVLEYRPFLIKPNNHELGEIFKTNITTKEDALHYAKKLQDMGAQNVLVSMAGEGAVLAAENGRFYHACAPSGVLVNAVGAGDSMVAGFLSGWLDKKDYEHAFKMGVAAGSASAFSELLATQEEIEEIYYRIEKGEMV